MNNLARLRENLEQVRERMADAARRSGRPPDAVRLVAVTKYVGGDLTGELVAAGCRQLGESRPQQLWQKATELADLSVEWHLIGHLQRNKIARTLPLVSLIHSGDSLRLLEALAAEAASTSRPAVSVLLEVNVSGDATKHGFQPDEVEALAEPLTRLKQIDIRGLMCMAGREGDIDQARREFSRLRQLRDHLQAVWPERFQLAELSMGMSDDFEAAIEEGATLVRVGSGLFEGVLPDAV